MQDRSFNPITTEEAILTIQLRNQGPSWFDRWYQAEIRLAEKMKPARLHEGLIVDRDFLPVIRPVLPVEGTEGE